MNCFYFLILSIAVLLTVSCSQTKFVPETQAPTTGYRIKYDHHGLRIPGGKFAIGLIVPYLNMIIARSVPGRGGAGGNGGSGGSGGAGGNGNPPGRSGRNGRDGNSGASGSNGSPGAVRFVVQ